MKPIIIGVTNDGKVEMTLYEFRKHMDDAYRQGCRDGSATSTISLNKWWDNQPDYNLCSTGSEASANIAVYNKAEG